LLCRTIEKQTPFQAKKNTKSVFSVRNENFGLVEPISSFLWLRTDSAYLLLSGLLFLSFSRLFNSLSVVREFFRSRLTASFLECGSSPYGSGLFDIFGGEGGDVTEFEVGESVDGGVEVLEVNTCGFVLFKRIILLRFESRSASSFSLSFSVSLSFSFFFSSFSFSFSFTSFFFVFLFRCWII